MNKEQEVNIEEKKITFEYIVYKLNDLKNEFKIKDDSIFTKLRLQKLLFLISTVNATRNDKGLLDIFDNFYALPYGPVERDIYDFIHDGDFKNITFDGNKCDVSKLNDSIFEFLSDKIKNLVTSSIDKLKEKGVIKEYLEMPVFDLVNITQQWTIWTVCHSVAEMLDNGSEPMRTLDILDSHVKAY